MDLVELSQRLAVVSRELQRRIVESLALREVIVEVAERAGMNPGVVAQRLCDLENQKWDEYLRHIEDTDPEAAAWMDTRNIRDIPTTQENEDEAK